MSVADEIRGRGLRKYVATVIFGIIILVFVFWGIYDKNGMGTGAGYAARVNSEIVSVREFNQAVEQTTNMYAQMFGGELNAEALKRFRIKENVLEQLISRSALMQTAKSNGYGVVDEEIRGFLLEIPAFQQDGRFRRENYDAFLAGRRMTAAQFEEEVRKEKLVQKVRASFEMGLQPSPLETAKINEASRQKINLEFVKLDTEGLDKAATPSEAEASAWLKTEAGASAARAYFDINKAEFEKPEEVKARHILIKSEAGNKESESKALAKIQSLKKELATKSFEELAKANSEDLGSKTKSGDLGYFSRGRMVAAFEDVAFSLEPGQVSDPIKTEFGYHLIKVEDKKPKVEADYEKAKIVAAQRALGREKSAQWMTSLKKALEEKKMSEVNQLIGSKKLAWQETGAFGLTEEVIPKMGAVEGAFKAAAALKTNGELYGKVVENGPDQYLVRLKSRTVDVAATPKTKPQDEAQKLASARSRDALSKWTENIVKSASVERNSQIMAQ